MDYEYHKPKYEILIHNFLRDYADTKEEIGLSLLFECIFKTTILVDSDHYHDNKTFQSLGGINFFLDSTPVFWIGK